VKATPVAEEVFRISVRIQNRSAFGHGSRDEALVFSLISAQALLSVAGGRFHSMIDPPENLRELAAACVNTELWPVLVGEEGTGARMLACPIILYDYPKVSQDSPGEMFDGTEIDEMLALRLRTLCERELRALREGPSPVRELLERAERMSEKEWSRLPACMRPEPAGCPYRPGDRVRLRPAGRADIFDLALGPGGKPASLMRQAGQVSFAHPVGPVGIAAHASGAGFAQPHVSTLPGVMAAGTFRSWTSAYPMP
jgi:hypothetical protein